MGAIVWQRDGDNSHKVHVDKGLPQAVLGRTGGRGRGRANTRPLKRKLVWSRDDDIASSGTPPAIDEPANDLSPPPPAAAAAAAAASKSSESEANFQPQEATSPSAEDAAMQQRRQMQQQAALTKKMRDVAQLRRAVQQRQRRLSASKVNDDALALQNASNSNGHAATYLQTRQLQSTLSFPAAFGVRCSMTSIAASLANCM